MYTNNHFMAIIKDNLGNGGGEHWLVRMPVGAAPSQMVSVSASVNLPLHYKVQKFSSGTGSPGWSRKKAAKRLCYKGQSVSQHPQLGAKFYCPHALADGN